jgi:hypothetical protein
MLWHEQVEDVEKQTSLTSTWLAAWWRRNKPTFTMGKLVLEFGPNFAGMLFRSQVFPVFSNLPGQKPVTKQSH